MANGKPGFWKTLKRHPHRPRRERLLRACEAFFWNTLCCRPDGGRLHSWWYHHTGNIARFFHRRHCSYCLDTRSRPTSNT